MFLNILPALLSILAIISIVLYIIPQSVMIKVLGKDSGFMGYVYAALIGSITLIPGFIAYPLAGILVKNNVSYPVIAVFITTLMMVGVITIPIEKRYFGLKTTLLRNSLSFAGALVVGALIGIFWRIL
ncbi:MAG: permease [bacterium]